jgi:uncharacterized protein involved in exopolysaccharide biosynthesis
MTLLDIVSTLRRRFWLIIAGAVIAGSVAAALSLLWPATFKSEALLLITKLRPEVTLDPRFQTAAEENIVNLSIQDDQVRRQTLVGLTQSADLLNQVLQRLGDTLPPENRTIAYLGGMTAVHTEGNLISFEAQAGDPTTAADMSNAWAEVYTNYVNKIYSATSPAYDQIQAQLATAQVTYDSAKNQLEDFYQQSTINELKRQIDQKTQILANLQAGQISAARQQLDTLLSRISGIDQALLDVQNLQTQLSRYPSATLLTPGEQFSLFSLQTQALTPGSRSDTTLELGDTWLGPTDLTAGEAQEKLAGLQDILNSSRAAIQVQTARLSGTLLGGTELLTTGPDDPSAASIDSLQSQINALQAELTKQQSRQQDLIDAQSLAHDSYQTLARKAAEVEISSNLVGVEVQIAARAQAPESPASPRPLLTTALAVAAGALGGLALAFALELWPRIAGAAG